MQMNFEVFCKSTHEAALTINSVRLLFLEKSYKRQCWLATFAAVVFLLLPPSTSPTHAQKGPFLAFHPTLNSYCFFYSLATFNMMSQHTRLSLFLVAYAAIASAQSATSSSLEPLASKHFTWPDIPYQVTGDNGGIRGPQFGYNECNSTTENQQSLCQVCFPSYYIFSHAFPFHRASLTDPSFYLFL